MNHCAFFRHTVGDAGDRGFRRVAGCERQDRELGADERHRSVQHFRRGIGFGVHAGGFLELQRRLAGDRQSRPAAEHVERFRLAEIIDEGEAFNPLERESPDISQGLDDRPVGGLGIHIVKQLMDDVSYQRQDGRNHLRFAKRLPLALTRSAPA